MGCSRRSSTAQNFRAFETNFDRRNSQPLASFPKILLVSIATLLVIVNPRVRVFHGDKYCAEARLRESTLLLVALVGGSAGAVAGQRHKTKEEPFRTTLLSIAVIQVLLLA
jgi:uncharacterized membrane protein YsdA (DUF1294 family)